MQWKEKEGLKWLEFDLFSDIPEITHALFTRHGGFSAAPYGSLNYSMSVGDNPEHVDANREKIKSLFQLPEVILPKMSHGPNVLQFDQKMLSERPDCDGLITNQSNIALMTTNADCQSALFYDPIHKVAANVHCGWRGNVQNIYREAVAKMRALYGTRPEELLAGISPSLGPDFSEFINYREELPSHSGRSNAAQPISTFGRSAATS